MVSDKFIGFIMVLISIAAILSEFYYLIFVPISDYTLISGWEGQYWALAIPVFLGVLGIFLIVFWIGVTMITTPPPEEFDFEEFEKELEEQEKKSEENKE